MITSSIASLPVDATTDITIVGGGLVGSLLAVLMAKRGHKVDVYERRSDPRTADQYAGRSINLVVSHRGWECCMDLSDLVYKNYITAPH